MWSIDRSLRKWLAARPACPAPMTTVVVRSMTVLLERQCSLTVHLERQQGPSGDFDGDVRRVGQRVEHSGALLGLGHQRLDVLLRRVRVDVERHLDVVEAVAHVGVGAEDPADVVCALDATPALRQLARPTRRYSIGVMPSSVAAKVSGWSASNTDCCLWFCSWPRPK